MLILNNVEIRQGHFNFQIGESRVIIELPPISLLPVLSRILEEAIHSQLLSYFKKNILLTDFQFDFRNQRNDQQKLQQPSYATISEL